MAKTATVTINPPFVFSLSKDSVTSGQMVTGTVTLGSPATSLASVHFSSSKSTVASVPPFVSISSGQTLATVPITTGGASSVQMVTITAEYASISQSASLTVIPMGAITLASLVVSPSSVTGGNSATGTVTLTGQAGGSGMTVTLQSSTNLAAQVPASVNVPAGQTVATFPVQTVRVTSSQTVTITATAGGIAKTATLVIQ
jgi:hypothetical protein